MGLEGWIKKFNHNTFAVVLTSLSNYKIAYATLLGLMVVQLSVGEISSLYMLIDTLHWHHYFNHESTNFLKKADQSSLARIVIECICKLEYYDEIQF